MVYGKPRAAPNSGEPVVTLAGYIGDALIGIYLGGGSIASSYGTTGPLAVLLIWLYYSSMILFLGAEFAHVHAQLRGSNYGEVTVHDETNKNVPAGSSEAIKAGVTL